MLSSECQFCQIHQSFLVVLASWAHKWHSLHCNHVSCDLLAASKQTKHGHSSSSMSFLSCFFFASVASLFLFLFFEYWAFSSIFSSFSPNVIVRRSCQEPSPFCLSLSLTPFHCFHRCVKICKKTLGSL